MCLLQSKTVDGKCPEKRRIKKLKVLIADDHVLLAQVLDQDLTSRGHGTDIVHDFEQAAQRVKSGSFDILLLDLHMPGMTGLHSIDQLCQRSQDTKVLLFSGEVSLDFVQKAMQLGAWGFVPKTMNVNSLHSMLDLVNNGQKFLPSGLRDGAGSDSSEFTGREVMILKAIAEGETNKDIARSIGTSEGNVKAIVRSICIRIGAKNRAHAVKLALEASVI